MLTAFAILIDGLVYAAYLFIVAVGLTLIFGVMKILNVAHGSFYTFGAYGAATAIGIYFDRGLPDAGGFLLMAVLAMVLGLVIGLILERSVMRLILLLIVAIAALNIISGLIMLVKNKARDVAILRTMGAGQGAILRIFFMSGAAIGALGTLAGLVLGVLFCAYIQQIQAVVEWVTRKAVFSPDVYFLSHIPAKLDWTEIAFVSAFSLLISFLATLLPAFQAARIDPVEALRYE